MPGAGFQVFGQKGRKLRNRYGSEPFEGVMDQIVSLNS
jgi:hypothetical protein